MSPKTAYLKKTSEQRCREAYQKEFAERLRHHDAVGAWSLETELWLGWVAAWKYLEGRLLKEIQS